MLDKKPGQLQDVVIRLKSLQQKIRPITIGAGATRPYIFVMFSREAAAQFAPNTQVYLSWKHLGKKRTMGYNVFSKVSDAPKPIWKIALPQPLLQEGTVIARIELVDARSIAASTNFEINVLYNPNAEETFTDSADYTDFQNTLLELSQKIEETQASIDNAQNTINDLSKLYDKTEALYRKLKKKYRKVDNKADKALRRSFEAYEAAMQALNQLIWGEIE